MSDERFEEFLQREAKAYNEPPASAPRDEMWAAIGAARAARRAEPVRIAAPMPSSRRPMLRYAPWFGMAATLLLGVGIGRFALRGENPARGPQGGQLAEAPVSPGSSTAPDASGSVAGGTTGTSAGIPGGTPATGGPGDAPAVTRDAQPAPRQLPPRTGTRLASNGVVPMVPGTNEPSAYGVASQRHLASAEALISVVTATPRDALMDSLTTKWAREMLSNTRLLLDSPAGDDQVRRRLLEDLETLLVQLVQRSGGAVDERELIDRTLQRTQLLTRLRTNAAGT